MDRWGGGAENAEQGGRKEGNLWGESFGPLEGFGRFTEHEGEGGVSNGGRGCAFWEEGGGGEKPPEAGSETPRDSVWKGMMTNYLQGLENRDEVLGVFNALPCWRRRRLRQSGVISFTELAEGLRDMGLLGVT
jgi:hypothetical protein